ncbi:MULTISPECIES: hypothetical protein [unclassified Streptomyces]|uniref:hypothetical protein n=1 Tax=unclassified Streptomyces TaxID=2593676 RepID=UPI0033FDF854
MPVRDALGVGLGSEHRLGVVRGRDGVPLAAHPLVRVGLRNVADRRRVLGAIGRGVDETAEPTFLAGDAGVLGAEEVPLDVSPVIVLGPVIHCVERVDIGVRVAAEGMVVGMRLRLDETAAFDPPVRPLVAVRLDQFAELVGAVLIAELLVFSGPPASALESADLVGRGAVLLLALPDARQEGR